MDEYEVGRKYRFEDREGVWLYNGEDADAPWTRVDQGEPIPEPQPGDAPLSYAGQMGLTYGGDAEPEQTEEAPRTRPGQQFLDYLNPFTRPQTPVSEPRSPEQAAARERVGDIGLGDAALLAGQGLTMGFGNDVLRAENIPFTSIGNPLRNENAANRIDDLREAYPGRSMALEMLGGGLLPAAGGAAVARGASRAFNPVVGALAGGASAGAVGGALTGAGEAESRGVTRAQGSIQGGLLGAAGGAAIGGALGLGGALTRAFSRGGNTGAARVGARREFVNALDEAGIDPDDIPQLLRQAGPDATIADLDPVLAAKGAESVARAPTLGRTGGPADIVGRQRPQGSNARLGRIVKDATGLGDVSDLQAANAIDKAIEQYRRATFDVLEEMDPVVSKAKLAEVLDSEDMLEVAGRGRVNRAMSPNNDPAGDLNDILNSVSDEAQDGGVPFRRLQSIRQALTRNVGNPDPGVAGAARNALDQLDRILADELSAFRAANQGYRQLQGIKRALEDGYQMFNDAPQNSAEQILARFEQFETDAARSAFRVGGQQALLNRLRSQPSGGSGTTNMMNALGGIDSEIKLGVLTQGGESLDDMLQRIQQEQTLAATSARIPLPGRNVGGDVLETAISGEPPVNDYSVRRLLARLIGTRSNAERQRSAELLGETLFSRDPGVDRWFGGAEGGGLLGMRSPYAERSAALAAIFGQDPERPAIAARGLFGGN